MPKKKQYSFDSKCLDLARHFLPEGTDIEHERELAQAIQDACEEHCAIIEERMREPTAGERE